MNTTLKLRRGTSVDWASKNPVLGSGEPGYETDTHLLKIGDGTSRWSELPYFIDALTQLGITQDLIDDAIASSGGSGSDPRIGDLSLLTTTDKTTVVAAINQVNTPMVALTLLYANAKAG
jgi:hypothetical protein